MIKNDRQFKVTRAQLDRFASAHDDLSKHTTADVNPVRRKLELDTVAGVITELRDSLNEYEGLQNGTIKPAAVTSIDLIPRALIQHRIAAKLNQRELAERLGLKEQQIQRYEAEDWATANLTRLVQVAELLGVSLGSAFDIHEVSDNRILTTLERVGIDRDFVLRRLTSGHSDDLASAVDLTARLSRIYGWMPADIINGVIEEPQLQLAAASFKLPKRHKRERTNAYTVYSHYLALQALAATSHLEPKPITTDPKAFRDHLFEEDNGLSFERVLKVVWGLGIIVLPLADPGAFHAMLWRHEGRNVIVLKQQNRLSSRWLFDLLHELRHAAEDPDKMTYAVLDEPINETDMDPREQIANAFAGDVLLAGHAEAIVAQAVDAAGGSVERLKKVVPLVARDNDVDVSHLANYLAYRLSLQGIDWWGAAANLQESSSNPWAIARDRFFEQVDLRVLNPIDRSLLVQAIKE